MTRRNLAALAATAFIGHHFHRVLACGGSGGGAVSREQRSTSTDRRIDIHGARWRFPWLLLFRFFCCVAALSVSLELLFEQSRTFGVSLFEQWHVCGIFSRSSSSCWGPAAVAARCRYRYCLLFAACFCCCCCRRRLCRRRCCRFRCCNIQMALPPHRAAASGTRHITRAPQKPLPAPAHLFLRTVSCSAILFSICTMSQIVRVIGWIAEIVARFRVVSYAHPPSSPPLPAAAVLTLTRAILTRASDTTRSCPTASPASGTRPPNINIALLL